MISVGFAAFKPSASAGFVGQPVANSNIVTTIYGVVSGNVQFGDTLLSVFDLVAGTDQTTNFDSVCQGSGFVQLNTTPNPNNCHLALLQRNGTANTNLKMTMAFSNSGGGGSISAPYLNPGDKICQIISFPGATTSSNAGLGALAADLKTANWAPTIQTANTLTQLTGISNTHPILFLIQKNGNQYNPEVVLDVVIGLNGQTLNVTLGGSKLLQVFDINTGFDVTNWWGPALGTAVGILGAPVGSATLNLNSPAANTDHFLFVSSPPLTNA